LSTNSFFLCSAHQTKRQYNDTDLLLEVDPSDENGAQGVKWNI